MSVAIPVKYIDTTKYKIKIHQEEGFYDPTEWGNYTVVQFRDNGYTNYNDGGDYFTDNGALLPAISAKLRAGVMFTLDYYSYSSTDGGYYRLNGAITGDQENINGFIIFEPAYIKGVSYDERRRYAEGDLEEYTMACNGDVHYVEIETESGREVESCGGFIGTDAVKQYIKDVVGDAEYEAIGVHPAYGSPGSTYEVAL